MHEGGVLNITICNRSIAPSGPPEPGDLHIHMIPAARVGSSRESSVSSPGIGPERRVAARGTRVGGFPCMCVWLSGESRATVWELERADVSMTWQRACHTDFEASSCGGYELDVLLSANADLTDTHNCNVCHMYPVQCAVGDACCCLREKTHHNNDLDYYCDLLAPYCHSVLREYILTKYVSTSQIAPT